MTAGKNELLPFSTTSPQASGALASAPHSIRDALSDAVVTSICARLVFCQPDMKINNQACGTSALFKNLPT